jgi:integrase
MTQVEQLGNLARENNPAYRLVTLILIRCGLRVSDALKLPFDCAVTDDSSAPYLRYRNHKMKREALVPIDDEQLALIREQQQRVLGRYPSPAVLFGFVNLMWTHRSTLIWPHLGACAAGL